MQLTLFSDLGLRVMIYLGTSSTERPITIGEVAEFFGVANNHLTKVVQFMGQQGWLVNTRGKGGGMRLSLPLQDYRLGDVVKALEPGNELIDCVQQPCVLRGHCALKGFLTQAESAFYESLNQYTLCDIAGGTTKAVMLKLRSA